MFLEARPPPAAPVTKSADRASAATAYGWKPPEQNRSVTISSIDCNQQTNESVVTLLSTDGPLTEHNDAEVCSGLGWLPREQTLGEEARRRVPEQFRKQSPSIANPPTLVLLADALLKASQSDNDSGSVVNVPELLRLLRPRLEQWVAWLLASQRPPLDDAQELGDGDFQWRGRSTSDGKLNPNTLGKQRLPHLARP